MPESLPTACFLHPDHPDLRKLVLLDQHAAGGLGVFPFDVLFVVGLLVVAVAAGVVGC